MHHGGLDTVTIAPEDLGRHRLKATTARGRDIAISLPRDQRLTDGAVLLLLDDYVLVVRAGPQRWLRLAPTTAAAATELGYQAGNLHWRVKFDGCDLLVAISGAIEAYTSRVKGLIETGRVVATEAHSTATEEIE